MKPFIKLHRYFQDSNQTLSTAVVLDNKSRPLFASIMQERGWRNNEQNVSCIPADLYTIKLEYSPKFKRKLWEIKNVPNRSECKFHASNFWHQLNGCVSPGHTTKDLDKDGYLDVTDSRKTLKEFHKALEPYTEALLLITAEPNLN